MATGTNEGNLVYKSRKLVKLLTEGEVDSLLAVAARDPFHDAVIKTFYMCGLRVSELVSLPSQILKANSDMIFITGKGGRERMVPFPPVVRDCLMNCKPGAQYIFPKGNGHISRQAILNIIKELAQSAGIRQTVTPHQLRHSFATHMLEGGADLVSLMLLLGHSDISTTEKYLHVRTKHLIETIKKHPLARENNGTNTL
tara:strand:+ start:265 stop:861 length:597 start_codon:yes stop_codon:yes gene_type:complete